MKWTILPVLLIAASALAMPGQKPVAPSPDSPAPDMNGPGPVQAEFITPISVRKLEAGQKIRARVTLDWDDPNCKLKTGAILEATVEEAEVHKSRGESKLALAFTGAQCDGLDLKPMELLLSAIAEPPEDWAQVPNAEYRAPVVALDARGRQVAGYGDTGISGFDVTQMELRGITHRFPMSRDVQPGDVLNIKGIKLDLGTGPNRSSVLSSKKKDIFLDEYTQMLLVPSSKVFSVVSTSKVSPNAPHAASEPHADSNPLPARVKDLSACAPPACALDDPSDAVELKADNAGTIATRPLGFAPRTQKMMDDLCDDESLIWIDSRRLLFAFDIHPLIQRGNAPGTTATRRLVRAALLDVQTHEVMRVLNWEINDTHRFIWPLDGERILVHVGSELRVYGRNLDVEYTILLSGALAFVRISPNGELMAIATLRERHSAKLHAQLRQDLGEEPDEDVDVMILDKQFNAIAHASTQSDLQPPTLLNEGQAKLFAQSDMHYRLVLGAWDGKTKTLGRFTSRCTPELSSVMPDLLFILSCNVATGAPEYRVLDAAGKVLLQGESGPRQLGYQVRGDAEKGVFAIKVVYATRELGGGIEFNARDLEAEEVRVYRVADGKRLFVARVSDPVASHDTYALSPDGAQLAVVSNEGIQLFPLPAQSIAGAVRK